FALAQVIDRRVVRDLEDPRRELELRIVRADPVQDLDEGFLSQVFGERPVVYHAVEQREQRPLVAAHQFAERRLVTLLRPRHDLLVAGAGPRCGGSAGSDDRTVSISISARAPWTSRRRWRMSRASRAA